MPRFLVAMLVVALLCGSLGTCPALAQAKKPSSSAIKSSNYYVKTGLEKFNKKQYDQAIAEFNKALRVYPQHPGAHLGLGMAYGRKKQYSRAILELNQAIKLNPKLGDAYYNRAVAYYYKRDYDNAWRDVKKAKSLGRKIDPVFLRSLEKDSGKKR